MFRRLYKSAIW